MQSQSLKEGPKHDIITCIHKILGELLCRCNDHERIDNILWNSNSSSKVKEHSLYTQHVLAETVATLRNFSGSGSKQIQQWKNGGTLKSSKRLWEHDERCLEESRTEIEHESYTSKKSVPDNRRSRSRGRAARRAVGEERPVSGKERDR